MVFQQAELKNETELEFLLKQDLEQIKNIQRRVANISIGASTLRGQGAKGVVGIARKFLCKLNLTELNNKNENEFKTWLDRNTEKLKKDFPENAKNWGAARKAINVFLEEAFYNRFLAEEYNLHKLEEFLEIPLDNHVVTELIKHGNRCNLPKWNSIKKLTLADNEIYQNCAREVANEKRTKRIYLDLEFWRSP